MIRRDRPGEIRPEALYRWPDEIKARLGLGRSVYDLVRVGGMPVRAFGRRRFVMGHEVIAALVRCTAERETALESESGAGLQAEAAGPGS